MFPTVHWMFYLKAEWNKDNIKDTNFINVWVPCDQYLTCVVLFVVCDMYPVYYLFIWDVYQVTGHTYTGVDNTHNIHGNRDNGYGNWIFSYLNLMKYYWIILFLLNHISALAAQLDIIELSRYLWQKLEFSYKRIA